MRDGPPRIVLAGTASGVGKTSLTLGLVRALGRRGRVVQPFKVGPDFLDPTYLARAAGRTCYNLDGWMTGRDYVARLFARACAGSDLAVIEGVMGLFDGADPTGLEGSTAEIAAWLDAPVLLAVNAHGAGRSLAAVVKGFVEFEPSVRVAGVIANHCGSVRHRDSLAAALAAAHLPPLLGAVPRDALPTLHSRHLGLVTADPRVLPDDTLDQLAQACEEYLDVEKILEIAGAQGRDATAPQDAQATNDAQVVRPGRFSGQGIESLPACPPTAPAPLRVRIGVARDAAFHFYYPDNLEALRDGGAELVDFSPLSDAHLPAGLSGLYIGGGYPEEHAAALAQNRSLLEDIRHFTASGRVLYAECGGLMYLGRSIESLDGGRFELAGVLPIDTRMLPRLRSLGYVEATLAGDSPLGAAGATLRGHEFHYSEISRDDTAGDGWRRAYRLRRRRSDADEPEGFLRGNVLASYVHLHFAARGDAVERLLSRCEACP